MQVRLDGLAALLQIRLQNFKFFFCHNTIAVVVRVHYCGCKGTTRLQLLQRVFLWILTDILGQSARTGYNASERKGNLQVSFPLRRVLLVDAVLHRQPY